jgi:DNA-binding MarR family transcriptional regulator
MTSAPDRLVHEPARLSIMANLYVVEDANATYLLQQTGLTWGNLASHVSKLEAAGYVAVAKSFKGKKPLTTLSLTPSGRDALERYRRHMLEALAPIGG